MVRETRRVLVCGLLIGLSVASCQGGVGTLFATPMPTVTPAPTVTPTPTIDAPATAAAQANATSTAQAANANATSTAQAEGTNTAIARATTTAQAEGTSIAQARATSTAQVQATTQALRAYVDALTTTARPGHTKKEGVIENAGQFVASYNPDIQVYNFILEARFFNPTDAQIHPYDYGVTFRYTAGNPSYQCRLILQSDKTWRFVVPTEATARGLNVKTVGSGRLTNFDTSQTGSNHIKVIGKDESGIFFVNDEYVAALDLRDTFATRISIGTGYSFNTIFPGLKVKFTDLNIMSLP